MVFKYYWLIGTVQKWLPFSRGRGTAGASFEEAKKAQVNILKSLSWKMAFFGLTRDFPTHPIIWVIDRNYVSRCLRPSSCFLLPCIENEIQTLLHGSKGIGWQCWLYRYLFFSEESNMFTLRLLYRMPLAASSRDRCWMDQKVWSSLSSAVLLYAL